MELYCGDNDVQALREVTHLRDLSKLIILDLTRTGLAALQEYRLFTIYHLCRLKVRSCQSCVHAVLQPTFPRC